MDDKNKTGLGREDDILAEAGFGAPAPEMDPAYYLADMEGFAMTEAQKIKLLETLWSMMRSLVERNIDVGEVDPCGHIFGGCAPESAEGVTLPFATAAMPTGHNHKNKEDAPI